MATRLVAALAATLINAQHGANYRSISNGTLALLPPLNGGISRNISVWRDA